MMNEDTAVDLSYDLEGLMEEFEGLSQTSFAAERPQGDGNLDNAAQVFEHNDAEWNSFDYGQHHPDWLQFLESFKSAAAYKKVVSDFLAWQTWSGWRKFHFGETQVVLYQRSALTGAWTPPRLAPWLATRARRPYPSTWPTQACRRIAHRRPSHSRGRSDDTRQELHRPARYRTCSTSTWQILRVATWTFTRRMTGKRMSSLNTFLYLYSSSSSNCVN